MPQEETIVRFEKVSFEHSHDKPILDEVSFSVRRGLKIALMGQNGAGKTTLFGLMMGACAPDSGAIHISKNISIATSKQVIPREYLTLSVRAFFETCFKEKVYDIDPKIDAVLSVVHLHAPKERTVGSFSGGQQARLLLASALIQNPDLLLLDEPTNNLDHAGIAHLTAFIKNYKKTVIVISHDAHFLNAFTDGVLYLDVHTRKIEQYAGNYADVVKEISARVEKENMKNARLAKHIQSKKDQANVFAQKGGGMRLVAKRMREKAEALEEEKVDVRKEDKTIRSFHIPEQTGIAGEIMRLDTYTVLHDHTPVLKKANISLRKNTHLLLQGPNGIGKSTLLEKIARGSGEGITIPPEVRIGYYRQDFSTLNFEDTVYASLRGVLEKEDEEHIRAVAANFLITHNVIHTKIGMLSEGQKGLVAFARLVLQKPGLLILDEPTNHINFRHIPVIAKALSDYKGAMILVSHVADFVAQIRIDEVLDLEK